MLLLFKISTDPLAMIGFETRGGTCQSVDRTMLSRIRAGEWHCFVAVVLNLFVDTYLYTHTLSAALCSSNQKLLLGEERPSGSSADQVVSAVETAQSSARMHSDSKQVDGTP